MKDELGKGRLDKLSAGIGDKLREGWKIS